MRAVVLLVLAAAVLVVAVLMVRGLLVLVSIEPRAAYWREQADLPGDVVYVALGDSLSQGIGSSSPEESFVAALADDLAVTTGEQVRVVNLSVTGATTEELVDSQLPAFTDLLAELADEGVPVGLVTLCIGSNDVGDVPAEQYRQQLGVVLDALPAGSYVTDVPDFNGGPDLDGAAELARVAREEVTARDDLVLVPLEDYTAELSVTEYAGDFFHPSDSGYDRYVAAFRSVMTERSDTTARGER